MDALRIHLQETWSVTDRGFGVWAGVSRDKFGGEDTALAPTQDNKVDYLPISMSEKVKPTCCRNSLNKIDEQVPPSIIICELASEEKPKRIDPIST